MVRLIDSISQTEQIIQLLFQFQYGAIDRYYIMGVIKRGILFQFQYGAIDSLSRFCNATSAIRFQFQYGAIDSQTNKSKDSGTFISIPVWCD